MIITNFLNLNNINNYNDLETKLKTEPYNLKFKKKSNLTLIYNENNENYENNDNNKENLNENENENENINFIKDACNGIIIDNNNLNIIRYVYNKTNLIDNLKNDNIIINPCIEGTLISLYKYNDKINISTKKCIDSSKSKWISKKSFYDLFLECWGDNDFSEINENIIYNFILIHPDNNHIIKYVNKELILLNCRSMEDLSILNIKLNNDNVEYFNINIIDDVDTFIENKIDINFNFKLNCYKFKNLDSYYYFFNKINKYTDIHKVIKGFFLTDNINSFKNIFENYNICSEFKLNHSDPLFSYFCLRKDYYKLDKYIKLFPEELNNILTIEHNLIMMNKCIYMIYIDSKINKNKNILIPKIFKTTIYKIHGLYLKNRINITENIIFNYMNSLDEKQLIVIFRNYLKEYCS